MHRRPNKIILRWRISLQRSFPNVPAPTDVISSPSNPRLKQLRRAAKRRGATASGFALAESPKLLEEALRSGLEFERVFASERLRESVAAKLPPHRRIPLHIVADRLFLRVATTARSQGVLALVKLPEWRPEQVCAGLTVALDAVQDPGNAGTIARSAEAFGASGLIFLKGSASPSNPKALRAAAGSLFRLPVLQNIGSQELLSLAERFQMRIFATEARGNTPLAKAAIDGRVLVIIGSETHGVAPALSEAAQPLSIPTRSVESLNAAVAASIVLYEFASRTQRG